MFHGVSVEDVFFLWEAVQRLSYLLTRISDLFTDFGRAKEASGEAWESLFVIALLLRCLGDHFEDVVFPLKESQFKTDVSYNELLRGGLNDLRSAEDLVKRLERPKQFPHIAVYYPNHTQFQGLDVVVAVYDKAGNRTLYGYQLKEDNTIPADPPWNC